MAQYADGTEVQLGDHVDLGDGDTGVVVALVAEKQFSEGFPGKDWSYLEQGLLVETKEAGLVHFPEVGISWRRLA